MESPAASAATASMIAAIAQRSGLRRGRRNVADDGANLIGHQIGRQAFHAFHAARVLHGDQRDDRFAINAELMKCFKIGLDAGAAARIGSGDGEGNRLSVGMVTNPDRRCTVSKVSASAAVLSVR